MSSAVFQATCSPFRNPLNTHERCVVRATGSRAVAAVFSRLSRLCGVTSAGVSWELTTERTFDNSIGELEVEGSRMQITLFNVGSRPDTRLNVAHRESI